jgi:hypothetical protein
MHLVAAIHKLLLPNFLGDMIDVPSKFPTQTQARAL